MRGSVVFVTTVMTARQHLKIKLLHTRGVTFRIPFSIRNGMFYPHVQRFNSCTVFPLLAPERVAPPI